jgi:5-methylcytosine-specific restriction protein A
MESERRYFARNRDLADSAKAEYGYQCLACGFDFAKRYGVLGEHYIECHHLQPLSARVQLETTGEVESTINDVAVVCSNCHRMIHRRRSAVLSVAEIRTIVREQRLKLKPDRRKNGRENGA